MLKLRKFLCGLFAFLAPLFLAVSAGTLPGLLRSIQLESFWGDVPYHKTMFLPAIIYQVLSRLILAMPPVLGILYGVAWWTIRQRKPSARGWAIAASFAMLLQSTPLLVAAYYILMYSPRSSVEFLIFVALLLAIGVAGLVAFLPRNALTQVPIKTPKLPRIAGDGTSRLLDSIAWLLGSAGYFAGIEWWERWGRAQDLPVSHFPSSLPMIFLILLATIAVHELGHALAGLALGMKLRMFAVGPFQWLIHDGKWKFKFYLMKFISGGAAGVVPGRPDQSRWTEVCMIAAGPLANLFTGTIALAALLAVVGGPYEQAWYPLANFFTLSLVTFAMNLIPFRPQSTYSDGARIYQLLRGGPLADLQRAFNIAGSTLVTPQRPKNYDIQTIQRASRFFTHGPQALLLRLLAADYFIDCGMISEAREALIEAESIYQESASDISAELHTVLIFDSAFLQRDAVSARQWWERMESKKPTHFAVDYWLAQSAVFWTENRLDEAREAWNKGHNMALQRPAAGIYEYDRFRYSLLRQALDSAPAGD